MSVTSASTGRMSLIGVRLEDIPAAIRRRYGRALIDKAIIDGDLLAAVELTGAVERPSDKIYWLPMDAVLDARDRGKW